MNWTKSLKILLLSFYLPPDLSAGSFRAKALLDALSRQREAHLELEVVTTTPNRYASYRDSTEEFEGADWLKVARVPVPKHDSGMTKQARTFSSFARQVLRLTRGKKYDVVVATSSRLMTAVLGAEIARRSGARLYLDLRDIFTDTLGDILTPAASRPILPLFRGMERWAVRRAARVNLVSAGFLSYFSAIDPTKRYRLFTNGIDEEFLHGPRHRDPRGRREAATILYAGNIGEGQGLHKILPAAAKLLEGEARFKVIGDGGRSQQLRKAVANARLDNVDLLEPMSREKLRQLYVDADILFLHLNDFDCFKKVLPSKVFEYAATGKPILAGVAGHAAEFIQEHVPGAAVFPPCDADAMASAFQELTQLPAAVDRRAFCERFRRSKIMDDWARDILNLAKE